MAQRPFVLSVLLGASLFACPALAQERSVLVLPWSVGEADGDVLAARAEAVAQSIASSGLSAIDPADARTRFEELGSAEPVTIDEAELERWRAYSRLAVRHLARADHAAAREALSAAHAISERAAGAIARDEANARTLLDTCLYEVRASLETGGGADAARAHARECRRLVPGLAPSAHLHPPEVIALLTTIDAEPREATLRVDAPEACTVRVNGVVLGEGPLLDGDYRVQVETRPDVPGRTRTVSLRGGARTLRVDPRFDAVVRTDTVLRLAYASLEDADAGRLDDAIAAAAVVRADEVWLLSLEPGDVVRVDRVLVASRVSLASVRASALSGLTMAIVSLSEARTEDRSGGQVASLERWRGGASETPEAPAHAWGRADWEIALGVGAGALAVVSFATSFALTYDEARLGMLASSLSPSDPGYLRTRGAWLDQRHAIWGLAAAGGVLGALAVSLVMEEEDGTPWWSWLVGGVGLVGAVTGAALIATGSDCGSQVPFQACVLGSQRVDYGTSVLGLSAPLLAVPLAFALRDVLPGATPAIDVTGTSAMLELRGAW